jgi:hypothetical protein
VVTVYSIDESIVLSCGPSLKQLNNNLNGRVININVPDNSPPNLPRIILKADDILLKVCLDRLETTMLLPSHIRNDMKSVTQFAKERSNLINSLLLDCIPKYEWCGIITEVDFPEEPLNSKSGAESITPFFDKIINISRKEKDLCSLELQFGFIEDGYNIIYKISGYEERKVEVNFPVKTRFQAIEFADFPLEKCGTKVIIDVNNKPTRKSNDDPIDDINSMLNKQISLSETLIDDLNMGGIIK